MTVTADGLVLACRHCGWRPPVDLTQGVLAAHFETEHDTAAVHLDLLVVCPRDAASMTFVRREPGRDIFECPQCRCTRRVLRTEARP